MRITDTGTATNSDVRYLWDGDQIVAQLDGSGTTVLKRYFANGVQVGSTNSYYTQDVLGSIRELTDQTGTLQARFDYEPFGSRKTLQGSGTVEFGFGGYFYHAPSGLNLTRHRAYNPKIGRFLNRDPIRESGGLNLYAYTTNNPVNFTDPSGNGPLGTLTGASVGAGIGSTAGTLLGGFGGTLLEPGGLTIVGGITGGEAGAAVGAGIGGYIGNQLENLFGNLNCPLFSSQNSDNENENNPAQDKILSKGEIKKLEKGGVDAEEVKGKKKTGQWDLYKDAKGNIYIKPKGGKGPGEETGYNINDF